MARNFNGFILAQDKKPPIGSKKTPVVKATANGKPKTLLQENLSLVKAETKKIYGGAVTKPKTMVTKKPLKATKEVPAKAVSINGSKSTLKVVPPKQRTSHEMSDGKPNHVRSNSRTLEPHEIILLKNPKFSEEPGVDSIEQKIEEKNPVKEEATSEPNSYESDFEDYESDFSDESNETNGTNESDKKVSEIEHDVDDDEEESMSENFTTAIEVRPVLHVPRKSRLYERSYEIMKKISLDHMSYELYDATPVAYQTFMKLYGNSQSMQNSTQTDTFAKNIETQTNIYKKVSVWTQFPIEIATQVESMTELQDKKSFDENDEPSAWMEKTLKTMSLMKTASTVLDYAFDMDKLNAFLIKTLATISSILDRNTKTKQLKTTDLEISNGYNEIDTNLNRGSPVSLIYAHPEVPNTLLTVHTAKTFDNYTQECLVCIWNTVFADPIKILSCWNWISCLMIVPTMKTVIVGGSKDG